MDHILGSRPLETEADELCQAKRYERSADRLNMRAGSYRGKLMTKAGEVDLKVPRLRSLPFETPIIECYPSCALAVKKEWL